MNISFSSTVDAKNRPALEKLLFFNPRQHKVREGILKSLRVFGQPRLVEDAGALSVKVGDHDAQALFAIDQDRKKPGLVGAIVFLRTSVPEIAIIHVAVNKSYALRGKKAGTGLGVMLVEKVKEIAGRIVGVKRIVFFYRQQVIIRLS